MVRTAVMCGGWVAILLSTNAAAQPGNRRLNMKAQVLDALFPLEVAPKSYFLKMILRFGDSGTQLAVVVYPGAKAEIVRVQLADMKGDELHRMISKAVADNPLVKPQEIAAKLKVAVTRSSVDYGAALEP